MLRRHLALPVLLCAIGCGGGGEATTSGGSSETGSSSTASPTPTTGDATASSTGGTTGEPDPCVASPQALADCVDPAKYTEDLNFIADIRTPGTPHWQAVQDLCADRLAEAGYEVILQDYGTGINVVGRRLGTSKPNELVVVAAHYDHIADCHGADDNASGVAAMLAIGRMLARAETDRTVIIACWDEEEDGLIGSEAFVAAVPVEDTVVVNYNFDMIGVRSDEMNSQRVPPGFETVFPEQYAAIESRGFRGDFIAIVASSLAHEHALGFAGATGRIALGSEVIEIPAGAENSPVFDDLRRSDHAAFWLAGIPALFITDTGEFRNDHYHCMKGPDEVADLDLDFAVGVTRATVEAAAVTLGMQVP
jgi:hypothetical protein